MKISELLMEAKAESLASKYENKILDRAKSDRRSNIKTAEDILPFLQNLESKYSKYVEWVLVRWLQGNFLIEDLPRVDAAIEQFKQKQRSLEKKDINQYQTLNELEDAVGLLDHIKSARQQKQEIKTSGIRKIVDNDKILLAQILTEEAAILVGRGTAWCTAYTERRNKFNEYNSKGPVYILIDKSTNEKFQIHYESAQVMDSYDKDYSYQKLLKIAPQLKQLEPEYSDGLIEHLGEYNKSLVDYINIFHNGKRWPEAEPIIMKDSRAASYYAIYVIKDHWPEAEPYIMQDRYYAYCYARDVIKDRWPEAEPLIIKDPHAAYYYVKHVVKDRWPEAEPVIMKNPRAAYQYAKYVAKDRWPEAEPVIMKNPRAAYQYAKYVVKDRWPEAETVIMKDPRAASQYAENVIKRRWPEAEPVIMKDDYYWEEYKDHFGIK